MPSPAGSKRYSSVQFQENNSPQKKQRVLEFTKVDMRPKQPEICKFAEVPAADLIWDEVCEDQKSSFRITNNMHDKIAWHECTYITPSHIQVHKTVYNYDDATALKTEQTMSRILYRQTWKQQQHFLFPSDLHTETTELHSLYTTCHSICSTSKKNLKAVFHHMSGRRIFESVDMILSRRTPTISVDDVKANVGVFGSTCAREDVERDLWESVTGDWYVLE